MACPQPSMITALLPKSAGLVFPFASADSAEFPLILTCLSVLSLGSETLFVADAIFAASAANLVSSPPATNCVGMGMLGRMSHRGFARPGEASLNTAARASAPAADPLAPMMSLNLHDTDKIRCSDFRCVRVRSY